MQWQPASLSSRFNGILVTTVLTFGLPLVGAAQEQDMTQFHITMGGTPGAQFSAQWRLTQNHQTVEHPETHGTVPAEFTFEGTALEGTVKLLSEGDRLDVDILKGNSHSRSSTQGKGSTLTVTVR